MKLCAAQLRATAGNIAANLTKHLQLIALAADGGADLVYFPELSLTGYEPRLAKALAIDQHDPRLEMLQQRSDAHGMVIGVGLPMSAASGVKIGMVWFLPGAPRQEYAKQHLHADELPFFVPGDAQLVLGGASAGHTMAPAICYESLQPQHAEQAAQLGVDIYLASVAKHQGAMAKAMRHYPMIARAHGMHVLMANGIGPSDDFVSVGQSAVWNRQGELLAQMDAESEGIVLVDTMSGNAGVQALRAAISA